MNKKNIITAISVIAIILVSTSSCKEVNQELSNIWESDEKGELLGTHHYLEDRGIRLFLPDAFEKISISEYQSMLDTLLDKDSYKYEINRINQLKKMDGGFHLFFDKYSGSTCTVNSVDFMPLTKNDAQQFLGVMRRSMEERFDHKKFSIEKLVAKYSGNTDEHVFKSVYLISDDKLDKQHYSTMYIITSNEKTVIMHISSPFRGDMDPFITKINM
ncbi:MAG: hypothetical protein KTR22_00830 [Flavobacteriaceae bacterium]|nr:hypothetical protein [Flavobacteriaceae bacterium]